MNFQTNKLSSVTSVDEYYAPVTQPLRIKTCHSDTLEGQNIYKRFQRSQSKKFSSNQSLGQSRPRQRIFSTCEESSKNIDNFGVKSLLRQVNLTESHILTQKFITNSGKQSKQPGNYQRQQNKNDNFINKTERETCKLIRTQPRLIVSNKQVYPFRTITENNTPTQSKIQVKLQHNNVILKKQQIAHKQGPKTSTNAKAVQKFKQLFSKPKPETPIQRTNFSTQCSIQDKKLQKKVLKCTSGCQTESKKQTNVAINTVQIKTCTLKIQTDNDWSNIEKSLVDMKLKLTNMEEENKKLRSDLISSRKQKQNCERALAESKQNNIKTQRSMTSYQKHSQSNLLGVRNSQNQIQGPTLLEKSLQQAVMLLKKQIESLKQGFGLKKVEQVLESMKRQNNALINQIQTISLRCRMLEQQNNELSTSQNENRKLKMEIKYFRGSIKDCQMQIDRLKIENRKLRTQFKIKAAHCQNSRVLSGWGSETDSLNLSVSFIRE